ncbi:MAG: glycosyltransferase family 92 protein [Verrucomicrobia bacterium]|nr:glycosyltransferase family 92 protein [Verrucomicrobiota bacterium]
MCKRIRMRWGAFLLLSLVMLLSKRADAHELSSNDAQPKKYCFSICSLISNEEKYLKEWIEYHRMVGVDHFYLYNNGSRDRTKDVLGPYIKEGLVTLVNWPNRLPASMEDDALWALTVQLPAFENAAKYLAIKDSKWLAVVEVDEFIVPVNARTIPEVLANCDEFPGIQVTSDYFDASRDNQVPKRNLVIQTVELTSAPEQRIERSVEKIILRPERYTSFTWPPYKCNFRNNEPAQKISKGQLRINKYVNRSRGALNFAKIKDKIRLDNRQISHDELHMVLEVGYEVEDQERAIFRFVPELLKKMGFESGAI